MARTERTVSLTGTRGNIYDRSGNVLAYNELSYNVVIQDNGDYETANERNRMLLLLVRILNRHGENVEGNSRWDLIPPGNGLYFLQRNLQEAVF